MKNDDINILHDHFKESFEYIREREKQRDRLFLYVLILFCLISLQIANPIVIAKSLQQVNIFSITIDITKLPYAFTLNITWLFLLIITMRYCQSSIIVERQYNYLYKIENTIQKLLGNNEIYAREGKEYLRNYPAFSSWVWIFYTIVFPLIIFIAATSLIYVEISNRWRLSFSILFDLVIFIMTIVTIFLYKILPLFSKRPTSS